LYISRQIALAHGGNLELGEEQGPGCRFVLTLPIHGTTEDSLPVEERKQPR
jgi:signal transduction histidine kinase